MRLKLNQTVALFFIYLLIVSPFSLAVDELSPDQPLTEEQEIQNQNTFNSNPTPENFNNLPNPTAADLAKVSNPTLENFNKLSPQQQGIYLGEENHYKQEFVEKYYSKFA